MIIDYAARARALVGTRFRPQGRGEGGLDCVGVVVVDVRRLQPIWSAATTGCAAIIVPRSGQGSSVHFRRVPKSQLRAGRRHAAARSPSEQLHLAVRTEPGFVHAHAGIGRVVETPGDARVAAARRLSQAPEPLSHGDTGPQHGRDGPWRARSAARSAR